MRKIRGLRSDDRVLFVLVTSTYEKLRSQILTKSHYFSRHIETRRAFWKQSFLITSGKGKIGRHFENIFFINFTGKTSHVGGTFCDLIVVTKSFQFQYSDKLINETKPDFHLRYHKHTLHWHKYNNWLANKLINQ